MQHKPKTHQSLERALELLLYFQDHNSACGALELSRAFGLHKSTASRILSVLKNYGFLRQGLKDKKYSLGPSIAILGTSLKDSLKSNLTHTAKPYLDNLRKLAGETTVLELATPHHTLLSMVFEGLGPIRIKGMVGDHHPYHTSAGGKAILAFRRLEIKEAILSGELAAVTPHSMTSRTEIEKELEEIRRKGYAFDRQENNEGVQAFGVPIFNHEEEAVAAVVIAGAVQTVNWDKKDHFVRLLKEAASNISKDVYPSKLAAPEVLR